jgi:hypothetical protein
MFSEKNFLALKNVIGLGVAGNFAGHLEQAGEVVDFYDVKVKEDKAPKGIFPFYIPSFEGQLGEFPISSEFINVPADQNNIQIEPEVALLCELEYKDEKVYKVKPLKFAAYNDCSIRRQGARKISDKKNWGTASKGLSSQFIEISNFSKGSEIDNFNIACFLEKDGEVHEYGLDSPVLGYSYFHEKLLSWIVETINNQKDEGPLESILDLLKVANYPSQALISIGATRYTNFGETNFLRKGDTLYVLVYNALLYTNTEIREKIKLGDLFVEGISPLIQEAV